jgi:hypothetical protein
MELVMNKHFIVADDFLAFLIPADVVPATYAPGTLLH